MPISQSLPFLLIFWVIFGVVMYRLYHQGFTVSKSIVAIVFMIWPGNDSDRATLNSCTGWVRHAGRFRESRTYEFSLDSQLSNGSAEVYLLDENKQKLLRLSQWLPAGSVTLNGESRYYLHWEFRNATGRCELHW